MGIAGQEARSAGPWAAEVRALALSTLLPGDEPPGDLVDHVLSTLPAGYAESTPAAVAAWDVSCLLGRPGRALDEPAASMSTASMSTASMPTAWTPLGAVAVRRPSPDQGDHFQLRRAGPERIELSSWLHLLESFGLVAVEALTWHLPLPVGGAYVDALTLRPSKADGASFGTEQSMTALAETIAAVATGRSELSPLDALVVSAGLSWPEVNLLWTYCQYRRQSGGPRALARAARMVDALLASPSAACALVNLARALFGTGPGLPSEDGAARARLDLDEALAQVPSRDLDRALRELLSLVLATSRCTWGDNGALAIKLASAQVPFLPAPRPYAEIYVWSPWFEGLHLRFGPVARGGLRWSDRTEDLRGEVLGLGRAQVKKNSLIVPTGAKGAFCLRPLSSGEQSSPWSPALPAAPGDEAGPGHMAAGRRAYQAFIAALLDLTDNIVEGQVRHPPITCRDGDDPYLVVAADKGTATFADLANEISVSRGFWLGDAFASGGSEGYDHKDLGITAKGTWLAVRRHFRALGMDAQRDEVTVAGVGDMSGDVFGNGMLCSEHLKLVAAFDHRHVFVDPAPDPARSFEERQRLARLAGSSWADYDMAAASPAAAVLARSAKDADLAAPALQALAATGPLALPELVKAVLRAPVDLLFFGGVGTFVKAPGEDDARVEDQANDEVRLQSGELRARVVAEGANLAMTQAARAAYSRRGGRVNADFVDNAAGVALSDREVNLKVLLQLGEQAGELAPRERHELLAAATTEATRLVLDQVDLGLVALDRSARHSPAELAGYVSLMADLEAEGLFEREVEALPEADELVRRAQAGAGFSRPELAVLVAYARSELARAIEPSPLTSPGGPLHPLVLAYFPEPCARTLAPLVPRHPLYRQLAASQLANEVIAHLGPMWGHELAAETGRSLAQVSTAYWRARQVLGADEVMVMLSTEAMTWPLETEEAVRDALADALSRLSRWYLSGPRSPDVVERLVAAVEPAERLFLAAVAGSSAAGEGPADAPGDVQARLQRLAAVGELVSLSHGDELSPTAVAHAMSMVDEALSLPRLQLALARAADGAGLWDRRQAHLLADDLAAARAAAVCGALAFVPHLGGVESVQAWLGSRSLEVERAKKLASQVVPGAPDLSLLAVIVRSLASLGLTEAW